MIHIVKLIGTPEFPNRKRNNLKTGTYRTANLEIDNIPVKVEITYHYNSCAKDKNGIYKVVFSNPLIRKHVDYKKIRKEVLDILIRTPTPGIKMIRSDAVR
jgi:hypothetical protein